MDWTKFRPYSNRKSFQLFSIAFVRSHLFCGRKFVRRILLSINFHTFSMGLRSALFEGHGRISKLFVLIHAFTCNVLNHYVCTEQLFCWNMKRLLGKAWTTRCNIAFCEYFSRKREFLGSLLQLLHDLIIWKATLLQAAPLWRNSRANPTLCSSWKLVK